MKRVLSSAVESELRALSLAVNDATAFHKTLTNLGHPQPPTILITDNWHMGGIVNDTVKQRISKVTGMIYYWIYDMILQG